jgi:hypothetical protein
MVLQRNIMAVSAAFLAIIARPSPTSTPIAAYG